MAKLHSATVAAAVGLGAGACLVLAVQFVLGQGPVMLRFCKTSDLQDCETAARFTSGPRCENTALHLNMICDPTDPKSWICRPDAGPKAIGRLYRCTYALTGF